MKVTEKIDYYVYWNDPRFKDKIPGSESAISMAGDNIYEPRAEWKKCASENYKQVLNRNHNRKNKEHDLRGKFVLLSNDFFYFGIGAIPVNKFNINIPRVQSGHGVKTDDDVEIIKLWNNLSDTHTKNISINRPHMWPREFL